jgi:hypothetical protein
MSKPNKQKRKHPKKKRKKRPPIGPDKVTQRGPLRVSQTGSVVWLENQSSAEQQREIEQHLANTYPEVCRRIDECVQRMCAIVSTVNPVILLQRAYWHVVSKHLGQGPEESNVHHEHLVARRLLDYGQSLIVSIESESGRIITDEQFKELEQVADQLFATLNPPYFLARTAVARQHQILTRNVKSLLSLPRCTTVPCAVIDTYRTICRIYATY